MAISDRRNGRYSPKSDDSRDIRHRHRSRSPSYARYSPELRRRRNPSRSRTPPPPPDDSRYIRRRSPSYARSSPEPLRRRNPSRSRTPPPPPPPDDSRDIRRHSPSYARYSPELHRRRNPSRSRTPPLPPPPPYRKPLPVRDNYNNRRDRGNYGRVPDNESDEELRDLSFEEYRRLKRQKLRRNSRHCIWQVTPSPPRSQKDAFRDGFDENQDDVHDDDVIPPRSGSGSGSGSGSDSDSRLKSRGKKSSRVKVKKSESHSDSATDSESGSEDDSDSRKRSRKRRNKRKKSSRSRSRRKSSRKSSDSEEDDESEDEDDSSEEDRKKRKSKSKRGSSGRRKKSSSKRRKRRRSSKSETEDESESEGERRRKRNKKKKVVRESSEEGSDSGKGKSELEIDETGLKIDETGNVDDDDEINPEVLKFKVMLEAQKMEAAMVNEPLVGPQPLPKAEGHISYGGALRPGEGDAIAQYVQQGKRIPRRGEVGLSADEISKFEDLGYVMSGSRHQRMNAIRIRKENQVYSAEDKRALAMYNFEEKAKREGKVMTDLKRLVQRTIGQDVAPNHDPFGAKDEGDVEP